MSESHCLLVDDDIFVTKLMAPLFDVRGYNPIVVHSGREALRAIERDLPSFVVLDINLPDISGIEVLRAIRHNVRSADLLVFMLTGRSEVTTQLEAFELGATEFFPKPIKPREIIEQIQQILWARES